MWSNFLNVDVIFHAKEKVQSCNNCPTELHACIWFVKEASGDTERMSSQQPNDALTVTSSVPSFHEASPTKMTPSQELLVQVAEANIAEKDFTATQLIKK
jgi:hypothetical protein